MTQDRISRLQKRIQPGQLFYVSNLVNVRYLTGFTGSNAALLVSESSSVLATDSRYKIQAREQVPEMETLIGRNFPQLLLGDRSISEILIEGNHISANSFQSLVDTFSHQFIRTNSIIESLRVVKDDDEIELIKTACEIATNAYEEVLTKVQVGQTERHVRDMLEHKIRELGANDVAFETIVATGANSAIPHHEPTDRAISHGDFLKIDFGAKFDGYHSDCTRTVVVGKASEWQIALHAAVTSAQAAGRNTISPSANLANVESAVNESLTASGYRDYFTHGLGHGVGLEIHEEPFFGRTEDAKIACNTVMTIEPGAYLDNMGGVRVEDTIVVDSNGYQNLTNLTYELLEL